MKIVMCFLCFVKWVVLFVLTLNVFFCASPSSAADSTHPADQHQQNIRYSDDHLKRTTVSFNRAYAEGYWTDTKYIVTSPARWDPSDWMTASLVSGAAAGLYVNDDKIKDWVQDHKNARRVGTAALSALGALYLYGYSTENDKAQEAVLLSAESFVITGLLVQSLKFGAHRHRPYTGDPYDTWDGPSLINESGRLSFPSGDASSAFAVATVIASEYQDSIALPPLVYGAATAIALGRIHDNGHWSSDVFVGSAIGYFTGKAILASHKIGSETTFAVIPRMDRNVTGLLVSYGF